MAEKVGFLMTGIIAFLISSLLGYFILKCFKDRSRPLDLIDVFLSIGLGLGFSAQIVFYTLLVMGHIDPLRIIQAHLLCLCISFLCSRRYGPDRLPSNPSFYQRALAVFAVLALIILAATLLALARPWGDWDGWSYWNYHANFIFRAGHEWTRVFEMNLQANHPWMLPLLVIWGWSFYGSEQTIVPMTIGIIFTVSCIGMVIAALKQYVSLSWALLGGVFLASIPYFIFQGTSQYADIVAAFFILSSCVVALDFLKFLSPKTAALTGLCLGMTASIKDNSIVAALLILILVLVRLCQLRSQVFIKPLVLGFMAVGISVIFMKLIGSLYTHDHYGSFWRELGVGQNWAIIGQFIWKAMTSLHWGGLWLLALAVLILHRTQWIRGEAGFIVQLLFFYTLFYFIFFVFASSVIKLEWLLSVSFDRMLYVLAPAVVFVVFYFTGQKE